MVPSMGLLVFFYQSYSYSSFLVPGFTFPTSIVTTLPTHDFLLPLCPIQSDIEISCSGTLARALLYLGPHDPSENF